MKPTNQELIAEAKAQHDFNGMPDGYSKHHEHDSGANDRCRAYELALRLEKAEVDLAFEKKMARAMMGLEQADE